MVNNNMLMPMHSVVSCIGGQYKDKYIKIMSKITRYTYTERFSVLC